MTTNRKLTIDPEFRDLCRALTPEERNLLEASLEADGCREPIITWANHDDTILDGHNRYEYCFRYQIPCKVKAIRLETRKDAVDWIINNQLGRRNLAEGEKSYLRGKRYLSEKKAQGAPEGNANAAKQTGQNVPFEFEDTAERLGEEYGVSDRTIKRDADFAQAVDRIAKKAGPEAKAAILSGKTGATKQDVAKLAELPAGRQKKAIVGGKEAIKEAIDGVTRQAPQKAEGSEMKGSQKRLTAKRWTAMVDLIERIHANLNKPDRQVSILDLRHDVGALAKHASTFTL